MQDRGQALTLEASIAAVLLIMSLVFALQVSAVTPLTESTSSQHIENQQQEVAKNALRIAADDGMLKSTVLFWNQTAEPPRHEGVDPSELRYTNGIPSDGDRFDDEYPDVVEFGQLLERTFSDRGIAYSIHLNYVDEQDGDRVIETQPLVYQGEPSNHAVTVTRTVVLHEDDTLYTDDEARLDDPDTEFFADNINDDSPVYNVVEVELVVWRM